MTISRTLIVLAVDTILILGVIAYFIYCLRCLDRNNVFVKGFLFIVYVIVLGNASYGAYYVGTLLELPNVSLYISAALGLFIGKLLLLGIGHWLWGNKSSK